MNTERPTPETDSIEKHSITTSDYDELIMLARRLERERDEARKQRDELLDALRDAILFIDDKFVAKAEAKRLLAKAKGSL
jgi:hypothetical protein